MDGYQITDALSASFFALLGIWAAVDRHHWFFRFAIVGGLLLVALFLPAYEVVIEFGLQLTIIVAVIWFARKVPGGRPRISMESALLLMVVAAVVAAVLGGMPAMEPAVWCFLITVGLCTSYAGLLALWLVCGRAPRRTRALLVLPGVLVFTALFHFGHALQHALWRSSSSFNWYAFAEFYQWQHTGVWLARMLPTIALATVVLGLGLNLARASRWFGPASNSPSEPTQLPRRAFAARIALTVVLLAIVAPLAYLFYRLMTPPSLALLPPLPSPNGFDDFVAAGRATPRDIRILPPTNVEQMVPELTAIADRVATGLAKESLVPLTPNDGNSSEMGVAHRDLLDVRLACEALEARAKYLDRRGSIDDRMAAWLMLANLAQHGSRGSTGMLFTIGWWEPEALNKLEKMLGLLDSSQCRTLVAGLRETDARRADFDETARRQHIINSNGPWTQHLPILVDVWGGKDPWAPYREYHSQLVACTRLLTVQTAAQAYFLEHDHPPGSIDDLVPEFLEAPPLDPYSNAPLKFIVKDAMFWVYSIGPDGEDHLANLTNPQHDDLIRDGPKKPPLWMQLRDGAALQFRKFWQPQEETADQH